MEVDGCYAQPQPMHAYPASRKRARSLSPAAFQERDVKRQNRSVLTARALTPLVYSRAHSPYDQLSSQAEGLHLVTPHNSPPEMALLDPGMLIESGRWPDTGGMQEDEPMSQSEHHMREDAVVSRETTEPRPPALPRSTSMPLAPNGRRCQRFTLGYREDCELCQKKQPGHYAHLLG